MVALCKAKNTLADNFINVPRYVKQSRPIQPHIGIWREPATYVHSNVDVARHVDQNPATFSRRTFIP